MLARMTGDSQQTFRLVSEIEPNLAVNCPAVRHMPCSGIAAIPLIVQNSNQQHINGLNVPIFPGWV